MCISVGDGDVHRSESWLTALMCVVSRDVFLIIVFNARFMESRDTMFPNQGIPYSRWCNLGGVILCPGVMELDGLVTFAGLLIEFDFTPNRAF
jgi:hypothetical protein